MMPRYVFLVLSLCFVICPAAQGRLFTVPFLSTDEWQTHNHAIKDRTALLHFDLSNNVISPKEAAVSFVETIQHYFHEHEEFLERKQSESYIEHEPKSISQARKRKNLLRKKAYGKSGTDEDRKEFRRAVKTVSYLKKQHKQSQEERSRAHLEKQFRDNFYEFAKRVCNGTVNASQPRPTFSLDEANSYFRSKYECGCNIDQTQLNWFPHINVHDPDRYKFDQSPIKPRDVKLVLKKKKAKSAPGNDELLYGLLRNLDTTHHFLATLFNKLLQSGDPPELWSESRVTLIYKSGDTGSPQNFRMISLTSCVSKILHQLLADRMTSYVTTNKYIDTSLQKAFISGINGCIEHNQVIHEVMAYAKNKRKTLHLTFFDLADAFGSVSHDLISVSLQRFDIPQPIITYISTLYSRLNGSVVGPGWTSDSFAFRKGVFQGDPLSPTIFIMCFNPIIEFLYTVSEGTVWV